MIIRLVWAFAEALRVSAPLTGLRIVTPRYSSLSLISALIVAYWPEGGL
jgi:hypothetical protein